MMRVAKLIDSRTLVITCNFSDLIHVGDKLLISTEITDPESGELLGSYPNVKVEVIQVFPRFCVAQPMKIADQPDTYRYTNVVIIGDEVTKVRDE